MMIITLHLIIIITLIAQAYLLYSLPTRLLTTAKRTPHPKPPLKQRLTQAASVLNGTADNFVITDQLAARLERELEAEALIASQKIQRPEVPYR